MTEETPVDAEVTARLSAYFHRNGYVRRHDPPRRDEDGRSYKKGDEVRLIAMNDTELAELRVLLQAAGFTPGRPYRSANRWCLPLYGLAVTDRFIALVGKRVPRRPEPEAP